MSKHTPGPWKADDCFTGIFVVAKDGMNICQVSQSEVDWKFPARQNAELISAAPELLASAKVCEKLLAEAILPILEIAHPDLVPGFKKSIETLGLVIKKAEGDL